MDREHHRQRTRHGCQKIEKLSFYRKPVPKTSTRIELLIQGQNYLCSDGRFKWFLCKDCYS